VRLRLAYLAATNTFTLLRLLPTGDRDKNIEILALRHQLLVRQRQVGKPTYSDTNRALLAGLCSITSRLTSCGAFCRWYAPTRPALARRGTPAQSARSALWSCA
jgi:hypothetical protein